LRSTDQKGGLEEGDSKTFLGFGGADPLVALLLLFRDMSKSMKTSFLEKNAWPADLAISNKAEQLDRLRNSNNLVQIGVLIALLHDL
jgi:hypothetical protein